MNPILEETSIETQIKMSPTMWLEGNNPLESALREITDNATDQMIRARRSGKLWVTINKGVFTVQDNAGGLPLKGKTPNIEKVYTPFTSGNYSNGEDESFTAGKHGVGAAVTRIVSDMFQVTSQTGTAYGLGWKDGETLGFWGDSFTPRSTPKQTESIGEDGVRVVFSFNPHVFPQSTQNSFDIQYVKDLLHSYAILLSDSGLDFTAYLDADGEKIEYHVDGGLVGFVSEMSDEWIVPPQEIRGSFKTKRLRSTLQGLQEFNDTIEYSLALGFSTHNDTVVETFVNTIQTKGGGTHQSVFQDSLATVVANKCKKLLKDKEEPPQFKDISSGMVAVIRVQMNTPAFSGQGKERFTDPQIKAPLQARLSRELDRLFSTDEYTKVITLAVENMRERHLAQVKRATRRKKVSGTDESFTLPDKLLDCKNHGEDSELFITEGDSAAGSCAIARNAINQAIFPVRGKVDNVYNSTTASALKVKEISDIAQILGAGVGAQFNPEDCRYEKIFLAADSDCDGYCIQAQLILVIAHLFPGLIEEGRVFLCQPPLFTIHAGNKTYQCLNDEEKNNILKTIKGTYTITRNKGLGEMSKESTKETLMDKKTRRLKCVDVNPENKEKFNEELKLWFSKNSQPRKRILTELSSEYEKYATD